MPLLTAGEPGIVLSLFLSATVVADLKEDVGCFNRDAVLGVIRPPTAGVFVVDVGLRTLERVVAGLLAPARLGAVVVGVRRAGVAAVTLEVVGRSVVAEGARDIRLGFAVIPSLFASSPDVLLSRDVVDGRGLCNELIVDGVEVVGFLAELETTGRLGGLLNAPAADVLDAEVAVGFVKVDTRGPGVVAGVFVTGRLAAVLALERKVVDSSPDAA